MVANTAMESRVANAPWRGEFVECGACGYEPPRFLPRMRCPKCFAFRAFRRVVCAGPRPLELPPPLRGGSGASDRELFISRISP
jgi:hypothetical protein